MMFGAVGNMMNYGNPEDDRRVADDLWQIDELPPAVSGGVGVTLPIHEQVRQSHAALCGMAPLTTDESTARCVEQPMQYRSATVAAMEAIARERDDLARRCADLENDKAALNAALARAWSPTRCAEYGDSVRFDRLVADYNALLESYESLKAQGPHSPVAPASPPHGMPAALGDYANEVLTDFSLPEPAQLNEAIPASAASQTSAPDGSAPAPGPIPANALRFSR